MSSFVILFSFNSIFSNDLVNIILIFYNLEANIDNLLLIKSDLTASSNFFSSSHLLNSFNHIHSFQKFANVSSLSIILKRVLTQLVFSICLNISIGTTTNSFLFLLPIVVIFLSYLVSSNIAHILALNCDTE